MGLKSGYFVEKEKSLDLTYKELNLKQAYRIDLLVNNQVVVEIKSVDAIHPVHVAQVLTYMKFGKFKLGLLINFNSKTLKEGIRRFVR